jgi:hypothetical protein
MKLIREFIDLKDLEIIKEDAEVDGVKKKVFKLKGIMLQAECKNRNGRIYPKSIIEREVGKYVTDKIGKRQSVGTLDHGDTPNIDLDRISHVIEVLKMEGNNGIGCARLIDTPCGRIAKTLVEEGIVLGMSTRGVGSLENDKVKDDFQLISIDLVNNPSAPQAFVESVLEAKDWILQGEKWIEVCKDGVCKLVKEETVKEDCKCKDKEIKEVVQKTDVVETAINEMEEKVQRNGLSKHALEYMLEFVNKINGKK